MKHPKYGMHSKERISLLFCRFQTIYEQSEPIAIHCCTETPSIAYHSEFNLDITFQIIAFLFISISCGLSFHNTNLYVYLSKEEILRSFKIKVTNVLIQDVSDFIKIYPISYVSILDSPTHQVAAPADRWAPGSLVADHPERRVPTPTGFGLILLQRPENIKKLKYLDELCEELNGKSVQIFV